MGNEETQGTLGNDMHPYSVCVALLEQKRHHSLDATSFHKKKKAHSVDTVSWSVACLKFCPFGGRDSFALFDGENRGTCCNIA